MPSYGSYYKTDNRSMWVGSTFSSLSQGAAKATRPFGFATNAKHPHPYRSTLQKPCYGRRTGKKGETSPTQLKHSPSLPQSCSLNLLPCTSHIAHNNTKREPPAPNTLLGNVFPSQPIAFHHHRLLRRCSRATLPKLFQSRIHFPYEPPPPPPPPTTTTTMSQKYDEPPAYHGGPGPQTPQAAYQQPYGGDPNYPGYAPGPNMGYHQQMPQQYPPQGQPGYYPPQGPYPPQGYYPPQQGGYYPPQGGHYQDRGAGGGAAGGCLGALLGTLACCCCLDLLF
ncbi:hypothetical protein CIB48_g4956 [Xylaria polymorpha]|nr:hypothetical protein CIB48_g4956 [Xylaria polymorpha]